MFYAVHGSCEAGTQCQEVDGAPACRPVPEEESSNLALIVALSVAIPVTVLVALALVLCFLYKKHALAKTSPIMIEVDETEGGTLYPGVTKYTQMRPGSGDSSNRSTPSPTPTIIDVLPAELRVPPLITTGKPL